MSSLRADYGGFSLIHVLVGMTITMIVGTALMQMGVMLTKEQKKLSLQLDYNQYIARLGLILSGSTSCTQSLAVSNQQFDPAITNSGLTVYAPGTNTPLAQDRQLVSGWVLSSPQFVKDPTTATITLSGNRSLTLASMTLLAQKQNAAALGTAQRSDRFNIWILTDASNTITECYGKDNPAAQGCQAISGTYLGGQCLINGITLPANLSGITQNSCAAQGGNLVGNTCLYSGNRNLDQYITYLMNQ